MNLETLPPLRAALKAHGLWAKKSFGQHFLLDLNITRRIAKLAEIGPGDHVLEVGPGPGGLTRALLETGARVTAVEKDTRFRSLLEDVAAASSGALDLVFGDALDVSLDPPPEHVVSNLPYNVGTPLLVGWLTAIEPPRSLTLMFQREVADRITAAPDEKAYGRLGVLAQAVCHTARVLDAPARAFTPPPKVDSAVVRLTPRADRPSPERLEALQRITAAAFGQRRKMLRASLRPLGGEDLVHAVGLDPQARAETISVEGFLALADAWRARC